MKAYWESSFSLKFEAIMEADLGLWDPIRALADFALLYWSTINSLKSSRLVLLDIDVPPFQQWIVDPIRKGAFR